jgi:hypothetical protein
MFDCVGHPSFLIVAASLVWGGAAPIALTAAAQQPGAKWDLSWLDTLSAATYRVVVNAEDIAYGAALDYAETFLDRFREAQGRQTRRRVQ